MVQNLSTKIYQTEILLMSENKANVSMFLIQIEKNNIDLNLAKQLAKRYINLYTFIYPTSLNN